MISVINTRFLTLSIVTTLEKAKYMQTQVSWVIQKAMAGGKSAHYHLNRAFYTKEAIRKAVLEIAPRFKNHTGMEIEGNIVLGSYVTIKKLGKRRLDKGQWAQIS
jgi:ribosomal protein L17